MDVASLLTLLLLALALAIQPWSVLAAVLLVASEGGVEKATAYVSGWVLALAAVAVAAVALYPQKPKVTSSSPWVGWVQIAAGVALGGWLVVRTKGSAAARPDGQPPDTSSSRSQPGSQPRWMARLDSMSALPAFVLGAFLPNYVIVVAAVGTVVQAGLAQGQATIALFTFVVVASLGVSAPLLLLVFRRGEAPRIYQEWRVWLIAHGQGLVTVVLAVVAVLLTGKGIVALVT